MISRSPPNTQVNTGRKNEGMNRLSWLVVTLMWPFNTWNGDRIQDWVKNSFLGVTGICVLQIEVDSINSKIWTTDRSLSSITTRTKRWETSWHQTFFFVVDRFGYVWHNVLLKTRHDKDYSAFFCHHDPLAPFLICKDMQKSKALRAIVSITNSFVGSIELG